jgi:putative membrane protein
VITRLRRDWIPLNVVTVWAPLVVAGPVVGAYWFLRQFGIDLLAFGRGLLDWSPLLVVVAVLVAYPIGIAVKAGSFLLEWWNFQLVRVGTPPATALVTRRGLINTQTVSRDDERMRGIAFAEPLWWRWLHLAETKVITTGLRLSGQSPTSTVLPRIRLAEARDLAARILPDGHRPLEATLRRHPRGALVRRLGWAVWWPALLAGALLLFAVSGALPYWVVPLPFALVPPGLLLAVAAYRALGHANAAPYLVVRRGPLTRSTVALQDRAVIGWTFQQSVFQRRGNRIDVGIATAAGERAYHGYDMGVDQALTFALSATPDLAAQFLEPGNRWRDQAAPP